MQFQNIFSSLCIDIFGVLPTCDAILMINKQYFTGYEEQRVVISETLQTVNGNTIRRGWDESYGKYIENGIYIVEGVTYELENVNGVQRWYMIGENNVRTLVDVEIFEYNRGINTVFYYKFGDRWYRYMNGNFAYTGTPPFYQSETLNYVNNWNNGNWNWNSNYVFSQPVANQFTYTNSASAIPFYRPVSGITETERIVVREPVVTEIITDNGNINTGFGFNTMFNTNF